MEEYTQYIRSLPLNDDPSLFGLHPNANITYAVTETNACLGYYTHTRTHTHTRAHTRTHTHAFTYTKNHTRMQVLTHAHKHFHAYTYTILQIIIY